MDVVKVHGSNKKHKIRIYALSTCAWCKMTKKFLKDSDIEYEYVDVDLCPDEDRDQVRSEITKRGGSLSYPTLIIDEKVLITGFRKDKIKEVLEI